MLVITAKGHAHSLPLSALPHGTRSSRGKRLDEFIELELGDEIVSVTPVDSFEGKRFVVVASRQGQIKRTELSEYGNARAAGIIGAGLARGDEVVAAFVTDGTHDIVFGTREGQSIRFPETKVRAMGRSAKGVKGIELASGDVVVGVLAPRADSDIVAATAAGYAKRIPFTEFKVQGRAGKGLGILPEKERAGLLVGLLEVHPGDQIAWELSDGSVEMVEASAIITRARREAGRPAVKLAGGVAVEAVHPLQSSAPRAETSESSTAETRALDEAGDDAEPQAELELDG